MDTTGKSVGERSPLIGPATRQRGHGTMDGTSDNARGWTTKSVEDKSGRNGQDGTTSGMKKELTRSTNAMYADNIQHPVVNVRTGVLELVIICFYSALIIYYPVIQQYIYKRSLTEQKNVSPSHRNLVSAENNISTYKSCLNTSTPENQVEEEAKAQQDSAAWLLYMGLSNSIPGVFANLAIGSITDNRGRKLGLVIPSIGAIIRTAATMLVIQLNWPLYVLLIGGFIDGCLGSFGTAFTAAYAYLADITAPGKQRTWRIAVLEAIMYVCASAVSVGVGYFISATGFFYPMALSLGLFIVTLALILFGLPETVINQSEVSIFGCSRLLMSVAAYIKPRSGTKRAQIFLLLAALLVTQMVFMSKGIIGTLYQMGFPFCWQSVKLGIFSAAGTVIQTSSMLILLRLFTRCLHENLIAIIGTVSAVGELILTGLARTDVMLFLAPVVGFLIMMPSATIKAVMSRQVGPDEQGALFAGVSSVQQLCLTFGTSIFNPIYISTVSTFPGLIFLVMAAVMFLALVLLGAVEALRRKDKRAAEYILFPDPSDEVS